MISSQTLRRPAPGPAAPSGEPSRRGLLIGAAVVGGSLLVGAWARPEGLSPGATEADFGAFGPFVKVAPDGAVTVMSKHIEFGQGSSTGLAAIVAEEMDADWDRVKVELAPGDTKVYANTLIGVQGTGGSTAINEAWTQMRQAGAGARAMFVQAAAQTWRVAPAEITVTAGIVAHAPSRRRASFAELFEAASKVTPPAAPVLKDPKDFTLIGTDRVTRRDSRAKANGQARFTQDVYEPGLLTAVVAHSPRFGGKVKSFDAAAARKVKGVVDVFEIPTGVAVVAEGVWPARQGRDALKVQWDDAGAETRGSPQILAHYKDVVAGKTDETWLAFGSHGDAAKAFDGELVAFSYDFPYLAHAPMEPMNCTARVGGGKTRLVFGSQIPTLDQLNSARVVGGAPDAVEIETLFAGGSFGRRAVPDSDYVVECVQIAKQVGGGRPVKLVWTREDDMTGGRYRPLTHHAIQVKLGADGFPAAWRHRIVTQSFMKGTPFMRGDLDETAVEGVNGSPYLKAVPVVDAKLATPASPIPTLWWRSVGATHAAMAMEHTIDQLAHRAGQDPLAYRRALLVKAGAERHVAVLDLVAAKAGWGQPLADGWSRGVAVHESFGTVVANVAEVKLVEGTPKVRRVVVAIDCGVAVAPDQIRAQMEGGVCYGLSSALRDQITLKDGLVEQTNFDAYQVLRFNEAPQVETHILPSGAHPTGAGEPGTPVIIPAVANALLAATGKPTSSLPFVKA
jgi:isoquinoline 1-oxidoreductase beta subunit